MPLLAVLVGEGVCEGERCARRGTFRAASSDGKRLRLCPLKSGGILDEDTIGKAGGGMLRPGLSWLIGKPGTAPNFLFLIWLWW